MFQVLPFTQKQIQIHVYYLHVDLLNRVEIRTIHLQTLIETCCVLVIMPGSGYRDKEDGVQTLMKLIGFKRESIQNK